MLPGQSGAQPVVAAEPHDPEPHREKPACSPCCGLPLPTWRACEAEFCLQDAEKRMPA